LPPPTVGHAAPSIVFLGVLRAIHHTRKSGIGKHSSTYSFLGDFLGHHHTLDCGNWDVAFIAIACLLDLRRRFYDIYTRPDKLKCSNETYLTRVQDVFGCCSVGVT